MSDWLYPSPTGNGIRRHIAAAGGPVRGAHARTLCGRMHLRPDWAASMWGSLDKADAVCVEVCSRCAAKAAR
jgi:hypothetical protein